MVEPGNLVVAQSSQLLDAKFLHAFLHLRFPLQPLCVRCIHGIPHAPAIGPLRFHVRDLLPDLLEAIDECLEASVCRRGVDEQQRVTIGGALKQFRVDAIGDDDELLVGNTGIQGALEPGFDEYPMVPPKSFRSELFLADGVMQIRDHPV